MGFLGVYRALYDYVPQAQGELAIEENDLLYVLDNSSDDGWWKAKKKAGDEDEEEPEGLIPHNYVEEAPPVCSARALYEYTRQTDEELSFPEDAILQVFDTSDPDWILVGLDEEFGFVPSNYIEMGEAEGDLEPEPEPEPAPPSLPARPSMPETPSATETAAAAAPPAAAALASVMAGRAMAAPASPEDPASPPPPQQPARTIPPMPQQHSDDESISSPALPTRPRPAPEPRSMQTDQPHHEQSQDPVMSPGGFHMYNINEMISVLGKRKKMPTTLGINLGTGMILIAPERASDGPSQEWSADKMTHYSREGKHVFVELVKPSKSVDFHAGAKDTAEEIVMALSEMAGALRASGLQDDILAGASRNKRAHILYDFAAQVDDEVTVAVGDEVIVLDDTKSDEWWQVRRVKNGKEGVVPSSYVEVSGILSPPPPSTPTTRSRDRESNSPRHTSNAYKSTVDANRAEEVRLTKEAMKRESEEVGPGMRLPERGSSLAAQEHGNDSSQQRSHRENGRGEGSSKGKTKPDMSKVRTWTDRSRSFSVEAQFLGLKDGKIHLHKMNGVKIAVPLTKMSRDDLEYVEKVTGMSLDDERPLADVKRSRTPSRSDRQSQSAAPAGVTVEKKPEYDWFQFFLDCGIAVGLCERYAQSFHKESMDESVLPDVDASILRNLGLREGDIIKVMRSLDNKFGRNKNKDAEGETGEGGLFSGPGGALRNNTRKGRPAPAVQTSNVVDAKAFASKDPTDETPAEPVKASPSPTNGTAPQAGPTGGFDDDAWDVKPSSKPAQPPRAATTSPPAPAAATPPPAAPLQPALTGGMQELSILTAPLQPTKTEPQPPASGPVLGQPAAAPVNPQPTGATPGFFTGVAAARQRPTPPSTASPLQGGIAPPPSRPLSAPQSAQPSAYAPPPPGMAPQMTGALQGRPAAPGQSLTELNQARLQQQYLASMQQNMQQQQQPLQPMMTGYGGMQQQQPMQPMYTGATAQYQQPMMTGQVGQSPFADPGMQQRQFSPMQAQPTGFQPSFTGGQPGFGQQAPPGPVNSYLPPPLQPERTGVQSMQPQPTGSSFYQQQQQQQPPQPQPLQPQQTGPPPPVRFGVQPAAQKLAPQSTGRRANLSQATPQNPFGF